MPQRPHCPAPRQELIPNQRQRLGELDVPFAIVASDGPGQSVCLQPPHTLTSLEGLRGWLPAQPPQSLGDPSFARAHGVSQNLVVGAMANGITSTPMVQSAAKAGYLAVFGAAGLSVAQIGDALASLRQTIKRGPWGCNLIYTPHEAGWERAVADLCIEHQVPTVSASAYLDLSAQVVRLRAKGLRTDSAGQIVAARQLMVKLSRVELARKFLAPAPPKILAELVQAGEIDEQEAKLASQCSVATDLTIEADSGGHTDNRPSLAQFPAIAAEAARIAQRHPCAAKVRLGAAGGLGTPAAVAAAFSMGAAYVLCGSVFQACRESGSSDLARAMLAQCQQADVAMAPAADMFEMGVKLQVLRRGTMFAMRAQKLYDLYRAHDSYEAIPASDRAWIEDKLFRASEQEIWEQTQTYWQARSPSQLDKAARDPKHRMALLFRWYLGQGSRWANNGEAARQTDFQVWCGPAMGAFNTWAKDTPLQEPSARRVAALAHALMAGAALHTRAHMAKAQGLAISTLELSQVERDLLFAAS